MKKKFLFVFILTYITGIVHQYEVENIEEIHEDTKKHNDDEDDEINDNTTNFRNMWAAWGAEINAEVLSCSAECGDHENAHYYPQLAKHLLKDIRLLPLWSCMNRNQFGYGRISASSASVNQGEFNKIKNILLKNSKQQLRIDEFIEMHLNYINGKIKIVEAAQYDVTESAQIDVVENVHTKTELIDLSSSNNILQTLIPQDITTEINDKTLKNKDLVNLLCPAYSNGDMPTGAHLCIICKNAVHILDECSLVFGDEEGYGERRICKKCSVEKCTPDILASSEIENWRGLAKKKSKKRIAKYLGQNKQAIQDSLSFIKNNNIPILKNGSNISLRSIKMSKQIVSLIHTCAFDSIFQIICKTSYNWLHLLIIFYYETRYIIKFVLTSYT